MSEPNCGLEFLDQLARSEREISVLTSLGKIEGRLLAHDKSRHDGIGNLIVTSERGPVIIKIWICIIANKLST